MPVDQPSVILERLRASFPDEPPAELDSVTTHFWRLLGACGDDRERWAAAAVLARGEMARRRIATAASRTHTD